MIMISMTNPAIRRNAATALPTAIPMVALKVRMFDETAGGGVLDGDNVTTWVLASAVTALVGVVNVTALVGVVNVTALVGAIEAVPNDKDVLL